MKLEKILSSLNSVDAGCINSGGSGFEGYWEVAGGFGEFVRL